MTSHVLWRFSLRDVPELHFGVKVNLVQSATLPQTEITKIAFQKWANQKKKRNETLFQDSKASLVLILPTSIVS